MVHVLAGITLGRRKLEGVTEGTSLMTSLRHLLGLASRTNRKDGARGAARSAEEGELLAGDSNGADLEGNPRRAAGRAAGRGRAHGRAAGRAGRAAEAWEDDGQAEAGPGAAPRRGRSSGRSKSPKEAL